MASEVWRRFGPVRSYVEPFAGSLAVLLARPEPIEGVETVNDLDGLLSNFWRSVKAEPEAVAHYADWPVNECIPAGTMIATPDGSFPVESITNGTIVYGYDGENVIPTEVVATKTSLTREPMVRVGDLLLTCNHPVWTEGYGYVASRNLSGGMKVRVLVQYEHAKEMDYLYTVRSSYGGSPLCREDFSRATTACRTLVEGEARGKDLSGLLDQVFVGVGIASFNDGLTGRLRGGLAGCGAGLDSQVSGIRPARQSNRWRGRVPWLCSECGITPIMVSPEEGGEISPGSLFGNARSASYSGGMREDSGILFWPSSYSGNEVENIVQAYGQDDFGGATPTSQGIASRYVSNGGAQAENCRGYDNSQVRGLSGDRFYLPVDYRSSKGFRCYRYFGQSSDSQGLSLQRESLQVCVSRRVYNFQTTSGNYFANGVLVHNCDLHARHAWLLARKDELRERLMGNPEAYDAKVAGWWVWGLCSWIGNGWCTGKGPWTVEDGRLVKRDDAEGVGIRRKLPHLGDAGAGDERPRPHLGNMGMGVHRQLPQLRNTGMGIHRIPDVSSDAEDGACALYAESLREMMTDLADRLRRVRVCCGDWSRVCGPAVTYVHGIAGVFLDPPYGEDADRDMRLYAEDSGTVAAAVRAWALANGDDPRLRIALCGYESEHDMPASWSCHAWKTIGGYGSLRRDGNNPNAARERVWFSPHCLAPRAATSLLPGFE